MKLRVTGITKEIDRHRNALKATRRKAMTIIVRAARAGLVSYMSGTPVWSGETVRNYKVSFSGRPVTVHPPVQGRVDFSGTWPDDVGEGRRAANVAAALSDFAAMANGVQSVFRDELPPTIYVANTIAASKANLIDAGLAPDPQRSRFPGGLTTRAQQAAVAAGEGNIR